EPGGSARASPADTRRPPVSCSPAAAASCLWLVGREADHGGHAAVRKPFVNYALLLHDPHIGETLEGFFEQSAGIQVLDLLRAAGPVVQLLGRIAVNDEQAAGLERA